MEVKKQLKIIAVLSILLCAMTFFSYKAVFKPIMDGGGGYSAAGQEYGGEVNPGGAAGAGVAGNAGDADGGSEAPAGSGNAGGVSAEPADGGSGAVGQEGGSDTTPQTGSEKPQESSSDSTPTQAEVGSGAVNVSSGDEGATGGQPAQTDIFTVDINECQRVVELVNVERERVGERILIRDSQLDKVAQIKADDMLAKKKMSHYSETNGYADDLFRQNNVYFKYCGENIAWARNTFTKAEEVMDGWMNSAGHRENILSKKYFKIGVAFAYDSDGNIYWAQIFKG